MGSKCFLLGVCCLLLVLSSQHTLFPVVFASDIPVSMATSSPMPTSFGHAPTNNGAGNHVDAGHPGVTEQKPGRFPIPRCPFPPSAPEQLPLQRHQIHEENDQCDGHNAENNVCALPTILDALAQVSPTIYVVELNLNLFQTCLRPLQYGIQIIDPALDPHACDSPGIVGLEVYQ